MSEATNSVVNRHTLRVEWGDCDAAGIIYYPNYFVWFDICTARLFESVGLTHKAIMDYGTVGIPLVDARAQFFVPATFGDELAAESRVAEWGRKSFKISHRLYKDGQLAVDGYETRIWATRHPENPALIKSVPIPREVVERFIIK